jgi:hypothetical protein
MAITETHNIDLARTMILWKQADALPRLALCSQKLSARTKKSETPESR